MGNNLWPSLPNFLHYRDGPWVFARLGSRSETKGDDQLPFWERLFESSFPRRTRLEKIPNRRWTLHLLQTLRGNLPRSGNHHRGRSPRRRSSSNHSLRYWYDQMYLLRILPGGMSRRRNCGGSQLRICDRNTRRTFVWQGKAPFQRRQVGEANREELDERVPLPLTCLPIVYEEKRILFIERLRNISYLQ